MPRYLNTSTSPGFAEMAYTPSKSDVTPVAVFFKITDTPGSTPLASETVPDTVFFCAKDICIKDTRKSVKIKVVFNFIYN
ncbi:hypothetical protein JCM19274_1478 [Algibacter lectus]|nr:hypothetical protein JCM19274_1478 [Algibacter lectus]